MKNSIGQKTNKQTIAKGVANRCDQIEEKVPVIKDTFD